MRRLLTLAASAATSLGLVACIFFTAGTNGYSTYSEGGTAQVCASAAECGEDAGLVCCASSATGAGVCQLAPCGDASAGSEDASSDDGGE
jgi:hypothetical protein